MSELGSKYLKNLVKNKGTSAVSYIKTKEKKYYERLDLNIVNYNKKFWKTVTLFLSDKITTFLKISLVENGQIIRDESKVANSISNFFENTILLLDIKTNEHS